MKSILLSLLVSAVALSLPAHAGSGIYRGPEGVMCCVVQNLSPDELAADPNWTNPNVKGFLIRAEWSTIEPSRGVYNFALFQEAATLAHLHKKVIGLSVGAGVMTPDWVFDDGAQQFFFTKDSNGSVEVIPEPWDPVFQTCWSEMIHAMGQSFATNSRLAYIVMTGPGRDYEMGFVTDPVDIADFDLMGGQALWGQATQQIAVTYMQAFPHTHVIYAMSPPTPDDAGKATVTTAMTNLFTQYPHQFGVACASLAPNTDPATPSVQLIESQSVASAVGFQMFGPAAVMATNQAETTAESPQQILSDALVKGVADKAHYVEVYSADCSDPTQQTALVTANKGLIENSAHSKSP